MDQHDFSGSGSFASKGRVPFAIRDIAPYSSDRINLYLDKSTDAHRVEISPQMALAVLERNHLDNMAPRPEDRSNALKGGA